MMFRIATFAIFTAVLSSPVLAADTPTHSIAVAGEAEMLLPPDYASIELGVVTQATSVGDALADNSARMTRVIDVVKSQGILPKDIQTSRFQIQPKYEKLQQPDYQDNEFRTVVGYYISNKITVTIRDLPNVAKIIDEGVKAGANSSGTVTFNVKDVSARLDDARRKAVENAHHKAEVLTEAAHIRLGPAVSITDNQADTSYDNDARANSVETVVVTGSRVPTPIEPGLVSVHATVTVVYATL